MYGASVTSRALLSLAVVCCALACACGGGGSVAQPAIVSNTQPATRGNLQLSTAAMSFGSMTVGSSTSASLTLTNTGTGALDIASVSVAQSDFSSLSNNCGNSIAVQATCTVVVAFAPTAAGSRSGTLTVASSSVGSPNQVSLSGTGVAAVGQLTVTPGSLAFGNVNLGSSGTQSLQLTNSGSASLTVSQLTTTGTGFSISTPPATPFSIGARQTVTLTVRFAPAAAGSVTGTVAIAYSGGGSTNVALGGSGVAVAASHSVDIHWTASDPTVSGYNVYRSDQPGANYSRLNSATISGLTYTDTTVAAGHTYYYVVTSVASTGLESTYSVEVNAAVPTP